LAHVAGALRAGFPRRRAAAAPLLRRTCACGGVSAADGEMVLHLLRHGQAAHNINAEAMRAAGCAFEDFLEQMRVDDAFDAPLTSLGIQQARTTGNQVRRWLPCCRWTRTSTWGWWLCGIGCSLPHAAPQRRRE
jgi:hypothetical protein